MARFVEFWAKGYGALLMNPDSVVCVYNDSSGKHRSDTPVVKIRCVDLSVWCVAGTIQEVLTKLQDDPQPEPEPAKAGDDITGWWVSDDRVIYVIGFRPDGRIAYLWDNGRYTTHDEITALTKWTRDPNRKGWDR